MIGESNHSFSPFQHIPNNLNGVKSGLVVANSCVKMTPHGPDTRVLMLYSLMNLGIVILEYAQAIKEEKIH